MPELPPPPDVAAAPSLSSVAWSSATTWVIDDDGRLSWRRVGAALGSALAVLVVLVVAWRAFVVAGRDNGPPPELTLPRTTGRVSDAGSSVEGAEGTAEPSSVVVVHVAGAVVRPGVYRLGGAPRVADALDAAGGPAPDADLDAVNLAATVADGERVYLARRGESPPALSWAPAGGGAPAGPLDLNTATAEQLEALPGVGPATASAIISYRQEHGRFRSVDELLEVRGIGEAKLAELRSKVRVR